MEIAGFCCALIIGIIMGLTGAGGAILTVPVLVYLLGLDPIVATAYSLFIVGTTAVFGSIQNFRKGLINVKTGISYALPSLVGVFAARKFIVPQIPETIALGGELSVSRAALIMVAFSLIMALSAISMLRKPQPATKKPVPVWILALRMVGAGLLVGMVGAGGGFLFVPLLVIVAGLGIKQAAATSLFIIAINSLVGFTGDLGNLVIDWSFLLIFTAIAIAGVFLGIYFSKYVDDRRLKSGFAWFVLAMAVAIFTGEMVA